MSLFCLRKMLLYVLGLVALWFVYRWLRELKRVSNKEDKYVYITGCDSGFGNLLAKHLDKLGFSVIAACYTEKGEDELKKISSDRLTTMHLDVTDSESVAKVTDSIKTLVGEKGEWLRFDLFLSPLRDVSNTFFWIRCRPVGCREQRWRGGALRPHRLAHHSRF